jgi:hypothetical protein
MGEARVLDVDPAEATGLDDLGVGYLGVAAGRGRTAVRHGTTEARARERQVGHRLAGFIVGAES